MNGRFERFDHAGSSLVSYASKERVSVGFMIGTTLA